MSAIFGFGHLDGGIADNQTATNMLHRMNHWNADLAKLWHGQTTILGHLLLRNSPQSAYENQPYFDFENELCITADATLFNREELMLELGITYNKQMPDSDLILRAYQKWGKDCPAHFNGGFAFAIWDKIQNEFFCARDHHGIKPFYYCFDAGQFSFASEIKGLLELPTINRAINGQWVADYLCRIWLEKKTTLYKKIKRLEPAQALTINRNGLSTYSYWKLDQIEEIKLNSEEEYIEAFRKKLVQAIKRRTETEFKVASELSGGLDSSTVTAIAKRELNDKKLMPYSLVLPKDKSSLFLHDEREWIQSICDYTGIKNSKLLTGEGESLLKAFEWNDRVQDEPPKEMNCMFRDFLYADLQSNDVRVLLSGFGGDEMVSQHVSNHLSALVELKQWKRLWQETKAISKEKNRFQLRTIASLLVKSMLGHDARRLNKILIRYFRKSSPIRNKLPYRPFKNSLYEEYKIEERFNAYQDLFLNTGSFIQDQIRRMKQPQVMYRLEACDIATRSFKLEYRYPLLDIPLIEFYLGLPIHLKANNGKGRYIFRKTMEAYLPQSIVWRSSKKGTSNPQVEVRKNLDGDRINERLHSIPLNHEIFSYADFSKETTPKTIGFKNEKREWQHTTTDFMNLLLAKKIEDSKKKST